MKEQHDSGYWLEQSILNYFDHRRAEHMRRCIHEGQGITPNEVAAVAIQETATIFCSNPLDWTEAEIVESIDAYLRASGSPDGLQTKIATGFDLEPLADGNVLIEFFDDDGITFNKQVVTAIVVRSMPLIASLTDVTLRVDRCRQGNHAEARRASTRGGRRA